MAELAILSSRDPEVFIEASDRAESVRRHNHVIGWVKPERTASLLEPIDGQVQQVLIRLGEWIAGTPVARAARQQTVGLLIYCLVEFLQPIGLREAVVIDKNQPGTTGAGRRQVPRDGRTGMRLP